MSTIIGNPIILPSGSGTLPSLLVTSNETGATGTATNGTDTVMLTEITENQYWCEVPDYGTWTVTLTKDGDTSSAEVEVTAVELYEATLVFIPRDVDEATWAQISEISQAGTGDTYWDVGDTKAITLNGTIGTKSYSSVTLYVYILHFNMPVNKSTADNNIIWGGFKTAKSGGIDVCLDDANYGSNKYDGTKYFNINHWGYSASPNNTNYGGWAACDLRYDILGAVNTAPPQYGSVKNTGSTGDDATQAAITSPVSNTLMAALPSDFRNVLRLWTRYTDNKGNSSDVDANITAIVDAGISLLAEFEVYGTRYYANQYEQNHQVQCTYYANGNSKIKYMQSSTGIAAIWWGSSARCNNATDFCNVSANGNVSVKSSRYSHGLAPAFKT